MFRWICSLCVVLILIGCSADEAIGPQATSPTGGTEPHERRLVVAESPESLLSEYGLALEARDIHALAALYDPTFVYDADYSCELQAPCAGDFPWTRADELRVLGHMLDPQFVGEGPPIVAWQFAYWINDVTVLGDGGLWVDVNMEYIAHTEESGWLADLWAELTLRPSHDGGLRICSIHERFIGARVVPVCWGSIKCWYW